MAFSKTIGKRLQGSFPGTITRGGDQLVQARTIAEDINFGAPIKLDAANNQWKNFEAADAETDILGIAVRSVKQGATLVGDQTLTPANSDMDTLTRGFISVEVVAGTPVVGGAVYVVKTVGDSGLAVGDFSATSSIGTGVTVTVANMLFTSPKNSVNNTAEVHVLAARI